MLHSSFIAIAVFALVYVLIVFGRGNRFKVPIWTSMLIGAALMVGLQVVSIDSAFGSINLDVMGFLFGMFSIVSALDRAGVLNLVASKMLSNTKNHPDLILMVFVVGMGSLSAFLVNDTIAVLGVPLIAYVSRQIGIRPQVLLIALCFGITVGSAMTPIGNPQNLLIALQSGIYLPFVTFIKVLGIPTIINLFVTYLILKAYFKTDLASASAFLAKKHHYHKLNQQQQLQQEHHVKGRDDGKKSMHNSILFPIRQAQEAAASGPDDNGGGVIVNPLLAKISIAVLLLTIAGFVLSEILQHVFHFANSFSLSVVAMLGAAALYALSNERREILASVDYSVLVFFAAMFVFTSALWSSGVVSQMISYFPAPDKNDLFQSTSAISIVSIALSQVLSNVPFVALYNNVMMDSGFAVADGSSIDSGDERYTRQWMMLAAGSTIAGNLTILAAASNIIIIEAAESRGLRAFSFFEFFKVGAIVTVANIAIYYVFIVLM